MLNWLSSNLSTILISIVLLAIVLSLIHISEPTRP